MINKISAGSYSSNRNTTNQSVNKGTNSIKSYDLENVKNQSFTAKKHSIRWANAIIKRGANDIKELTEEMNEALKQGDLEGAIDKGIIRSDIKERLFNVAKVVFGLTEHKAAAKYLKKPKK